MKNVLKLGAVVLAIVMVLSMGVTAFASGSATLTNHDATATGNEVVRVLKEITVYNPDSSTVNEPTITYTYVLTSGSANKSITDSESVQVLTKSGSLTGVKMTSQTNSTQNDAWTSLSYGPDRTETLAASAAGSENTKWIDIDFSGVNFGAAGVYRYVITETAAAYTTSGVVEGNTGHVRYLDVYVKDAASQSSNLDQASDWDVFGYSLFTADEDITPTNEGDTAGSSAYKTTGFIADSVYSKTADQYYTFNLVVGKTVVNDNYTKNTHHQFPFTITLTNSAVTDPVLPIMTVSSNATQAALSSGAIAGTWSPTIADSATVTYVGIPAGTSIAIKETNDVSGTTYSSASSGAAITVGESTKGSEAATKSIYTSVESNSATVAIGDTAGAAVSNNASVTFTNTMLQISPTGYVARIAPYALMLGVGLILVLFMRRRKNRAEA